MFPGHSPAAASPGAAGVVVYGDAMPEKLTDAQEQTLSNFVQHASSLDETLAVILSGSLVRGWGDEHSDVDLLVMVTDEGYANRLKQHTTAVYDESFATYEGGAIDAKFLNRDYFEHAREHAIEATRNAFFGARVAWSRIDGVDQLVREIGTFPEQGVDERIARFTAQLEAARWYITQADKRQNLYLAQWSGTRAILFAARTILAHNRMLFPFHKWLLQALEEAPDKPAGLLDAIHAVTRSPSAATIDPLCDLVMQHHDWPTDPGGWPEAFIRDTEQVWLRQTPGVEDL